MSDRERALSDALAAIWPSNLAKVPDHLPDDFVFPVDLTAAELRKVAAAIGMANEAQGTNRLNAAQMVPGVLKCAKCDFRLIKTTLTPSGAYANDEPDTCPNCSVPMWNVTWKDEAHQAYKVAESQMERALEAERKLEARREPIAGTIFEHGDAVEWITANCMAIRRDNGALDYSLGAMIKAYEAGKAAASAGEP